MAQHSFVGPQAHAYHLWRLILELGFIPALWCFFHCTYLAPNRYESCKTNSLRESTRRLKQEQEEENLKFGLT